MKIEEIKAALDVVRACDNVLLATKRRDGYPEIRHMANMLNRDAREMTLYFITTNYSPKVLQIACLDKCCLYYYDAETHHALRLFGVMETLDDAETRHKYWHDDFKKFGYSGPDDENFVILKFVCDEYKYYVGNEMKRGLLMH